MASLELLPGLLIALLIFFFITVSFSSPHDNKLPPSPPGDPIIGHARLIPFDYQWKTFASWKKKYGSHVSILSSCMLLLIVNATIGDIIYANVLGRQMIILNSFVAARDIMGRGAIHSDRPRLIPQEL